MTISQYCHIVGTLPCLSDRDLKDLIEAIRKEQDSRKARIASHPVELSERN